MKEIVSFDKFKTDTVNALNNKQLRSNFKLATDGLIDKRRKVFEDVDEWLELRELGNRIRKNALAKLPDLLEMLEYNCTKNGIKVHWAESISEANEVILEIAKHSGVNKVVKGKSMVTEEMGLNYFLQEHGIETLETDLGEYIIQLDGEFPSHIIMPAIHKNKEQISNIFFEKVDPTKRLETPEEMTKIARKVLRQKFFDADMGVSGVNFAVAETGTICLVENEGNGRFCTTLPPIHIAVMGIEKVIERLDEIPTLLSLLTRSATGQLISTYFNMINSPRKSGEKDGPKEVHLLLLDNGRSVMHSDPLLRETLLCIRCGACMNHCPVYSRVGGHTYSSTYPGPIGKILTPQIHDLNSAGHLVDASSLCGACVEVCPVKIPITDILLRLRRDKVKSKRNIQEMKFSGWKNIKERTFWLLWSIFFADSKKFKLIYILISKIWSFIPKNISIIQGWTFCRSLPVLPKKNLHQLVNEEGISEE